MDKMNILLRTKEVFVYNCSDKKLFPGGKKLTGIYQGQSSFTQKPPVNMNM